MFNEEKCFFFFSSFLGNFNSMEIKKKRISNESGLVNFSKQRKQLKYQKMDECYVFVNEKFHQGVIINFRTRENLFTITQFENSLEFLFPKVLLYLVHDFYFEGYQIAIHVNNFESLLWINDDDKHLLPLNARDEIDRYELKSQNDKLDILYSFSPTLGNTISTFAQVLGDLMPGNVCSIVFDLLFGFNYI